MISLKYSYHNINFVTQCYLRRMGSLSNAASMNIFSEPNQRSCQFYLDNISSAVTCETSARELIEVQIDLKERG